MASEKWGPQIPADGPDSGTPETREPGWAAQKLPSRHLDRGHECVSEILRSGMIPAAGITLNTKAAAEYFAAEFAAVFADGWNAAIEALRRRRNEWDFPKTPWGFRDEMMGCGHAADYLAAQCPEPPEPDALARELAAAQGAEDA